MAVCPWCATEKKDPAAPCPNCGKSGAAARGASGAPPNVAVAVSRPPVSFDADLIIPAPAASRPSLPVQHSSASSAFDDDDIVSGSADLQLDLKGATAAKAPVSAPKMASSGSGGGGGGLDPFGDYDDGSAGSGLNIDLDMVPPARVSGSLPAGRLSGPPSHRSLPAPDGAPPIETATGDADPFEARALADYGPVPDALWLTPMYALRVTKRRGELRQLLAAKRAEMARAAAQADDALVAFAERVRATAEAAGWRGFANVMADEEVLRGRDSGLAAEMDAYRAELAQVDARLAEVEGAFEHTKAEERTVEAHLAAAEETRARADAKVKRIDIELRNATAGTGGDAGNTQALVDARLAERDARAEEVTAQLGVIAEIQTRLAAARRNVATAAAKVSAVRSDRAAAESRFRRQTGTRSEGVEESRRRVRASLAEAGRLAFMDEGAFGDDFAMAREDVRLASTRAADAARAVALHEAALTVHDPQKVQQGFILMGGVVALALLLLLFPFIYRAIVV
jgi:hypothetical protein